jgi:hypothetical protein
VDRRLSREGEIVEEGGRPLAAFGGVCASAGAGCGMCGVLAARRVPVALLNLAAPARAGDRVRVDVDAAALDRVAATCFALPLLALLAGTLVGTYVFTGIAAPGSGVDAEWAGGLTGLFSAAVTFAFVGRSGDTLLRRLKLNARLVRIDT